jgi:hypothetical protein
MKSLFKNIASLSLGVLVLASAQPVSASTILVDRGLPTANLNNVAGASRSNVAWAFAPDTAGTWLVGDTFTNTSSANYFIDTIRLWTVGATTSASLLGGLDSAATFATISSTYTATAVQYAGALDYQGSSGSYIAMTQLDFDVGITLGAGETYNFFLAGSGPSSPVVPFAHASNAALSGSPQDGADNSMLYGLVTGGSIAAADVGTWTSLGSGWDKASDVNVQVFGTVPEAGSSLVLLGMALAGLSALRMRTKKN